MQTAVFGGWQKVGVAYPKGSPQATALALVEAIEHEGKGRVFVRCPVVEILREAVPDPSDEAEGAGKQQGQGLATTRTRAVGVRLADGTELRARNVVSALGYRVTETLLASTTAAPNNANTVGTNSNSSAASTKAGGGGGGGGGDHGSSISSAPTPTASPPLGPVPLPLKPLATPQGCGFVMANIGLVGTAAELGITFSNLWVQVSEE
jgi:phytoene dehydrogenase-like protein